MGRNGKIKEGCALLTSLECGWIWMMWGRIVWMTGEMAIVKYAGMGVCVPLNKNRSKVINEMRFCVKLKH